jgi:hypothetical protein
MASLCGKQQINSRAKTIVYNVRYEYLLLMEIILSDNAACLTLHCVL